MGDSTGFANGAQGIHPLCAMDAYIDVVGAELRQLLAIRAARAQAQGKDESGSSATRMDSGSNETKRDNGVAIHVNPLVSGGRAAATVSDPGDPFAGLVAHGSTAVPAHAGLLARVQGYLSDLCRPGQWCLSVDRRRAHVQWTVDGAVANDILRGFRACCDSRPELELARYNEARGVARALWFTPGAGWVDSIDFTVTNNGDNGCTAEV